MTNLEFSRLFTDYYMQRKEGIKGVTFELKQETLTRLKIINEGFLPGARKPIYHFDRVLNSMTIEIKDYAIDRGFYDLQLMLTQIDNFSIDAETDGKISLQMTIANAFNRR